MWPHRTSICRRGAINIELSGLLLSVFNPLLTILNALFGWFQDAADVMSAIVLLPFDLIKLVQIIQRITGAADTIDVALGEMTGPIAQNRAFDIAQPLLTGLLGAVLGTAKSNPGIGVGTSVGAIGFPDSGLVGAGLEIAMPVETAFGFLQSQILDAMRDAAAPLFGYVSVRLCPQTTTLLGMQQWPISVMIEVVGFGDAFGKQFVAQLQQKALNFVASGGDAILHWGLENDQVSSTVLNKTPSLLRPHAVQSGAEPDRRVSPGAGVYQVEPGRQPGQPVPGVRQRLHGADGLLTMRVGGRTP